MNVLRIVAENLEEMGSAKMFINSLPGVSASDRDLSGAEEQYGDLAGRVVVELTEDAELTDRDLELLKSFFEKHGIETAVDDYGTGYSNVNNLLRYMPDYVKIDRALLSEIQDKPQKQHFVREVIDFCHDNGIKALAEGVETVEELRCVIYLGADLIQGFYTAAPSDHFIRSIDETVRDEIRQFHREKMDGSANRSYIAGKTNRVSLAALTRIGCSEIVIGRGTTVYKEITVIGIPGNRTDIHIRIEEGYSGRITLEDVFLSNTRNRPCIELCGNTDVTLVAVGENTLQGNGILVPESSRLTVEGSGSMRIRLNSAEYYGIGAPADSQHGRLTFDLNGSVEITGNGISGSCIGSGLGGRIRINSGIFLLEASGNSCVCIGAQTGSTDVKLRSCNAALEFNVIDGIGVGSLGGSAKVFIGNSSFKLSGSGSRSAGLGTLDGESSETRIADSSVAISMSGDQLTGVGSLEGRTALRLDNSMLKIDTSGDRALAVGGYNEDQESVMHRADTRWNVDNKLGRDTFAKPGMLRIVDGRGSFMLNGEEIKHEEAISDNQQGQ